MPTLNISTPAALHRLAALPFYGQAEAVIRRVDPLWKVDMSEPHEWRVKLQQECDCTCPNCDYVEEKSVSIEARSEDEAVEAAENAHPDWEVLSAKMRPVPCATLPDGLLKEFAA